MFYKISYENSTYFSKIVQINKILVEWSPKVCESVCVTSEEIISSLYLYNLHVGRWNEEIDRRIIRVQDISKYEMSVWSSFSLYWILFYMILERRCWLLAYRKKNHILRAAILSHSKKWLTAIVNQYSLFNGSIVLTAHIYDSLLDCVLSKSSSQVYGAMTQKLISSSGQKMSMIGYFSTEVKKKKTDRSPSGVAILFMKSSSASSIDAEHKTI